eukprot:TRINITY_DN27587_c0_g1_i1.p1 TRINITY_DN27587_c0_g1~~TRINITY_DN27587_c0_g1_i1.p1  ORF type:complete len:137 (+),score=1.77 TRINITY_DN27587_c0_g1_i1:289-699(+)
MTAAVAASPATRLGGICRDPSSGCCAAGALRAWDLEVCGLLRYMLVCVCERRAYRHMLQCDYVRPGAADIGAMHVRVLLPLEATKHHLDACWTAHRRHAALETAAPSVRVTRVATPSLHLLSIGNRLLSNAQCASM